MSRVFERPGVVLGQEISEQEYTPVTIQIGEDKTFFQQAPITEIRIDQQVDFSLAKTMAGNFNLVTFQDLPVTITIQGLRSLYPACDKSKSQESIGQVYKKSKASNQNNLVQLTIGSEVYKATIVALTQMSSQQAPGILIYNLTLFGVRTA